MIIFPHPHFLISTSHMTSPTCPPYYFMSSFFPLFIDKLPNIIRTVRMYMDVGTPTATLGTSQSPHLPKRKVPPSTFELFNANSSLTDGLRNNTAHVC